MVLVFDSSLCNPLHGRLNCPPACTSAKEPKHSLVIYILNSIYTRDNCGTWVTPGINSDIFAIDLNTLYASSVALIDVSETPDQFSHLF